MNNKGFNIGPILVAFICCGWPLIVHFLLLRGPGWVRRLIAAADNRKIKMGGK